MLPVRNLCHAPDDGKSHCTLTVNVLAVAMTCEYYAHPVSCQREINKGV